MNQVATFILLTFCIAIGCVLGFVIGFFAPYWVAQLYLLSASSDPTAAGGAWILIFYTVPIGVLVGGGAGFAIPYSIIRKKRDEKIKSAMRLNVEKQVEVPKDKFESTGDIYN